MNFLFLSLSLISLSFGGIMLAQDVIKNSSPTVVIILGPPGSGKGTQAVRIAKELNIPHISTGDLFRENISQNTELGQRAKTYMNAGKLVPDELVLDMLFDRVSRPDSAKGYLLDGVPHTMPQAEALDKHFASTHAKLIVLDLEVPDDIIVKRIAGRLTCKGCNQMYNKYFSPPQKEAICDKCQGELIQRADDKPEVVEERLRVYHSQTKPLIEYYKKKGNLQTFDGTQSPDAVFQAIMKKIKG